MGVLYLVADVPCVVVPNVTRPQWASKGGEGDKSGRVQKRGLSRKNVLQAKKLAIVVGLGEP